VILLGDGAGSFGLPLRSPAPTAPSGIGAADWNGDGRMDLAVVGFGSASLSLLLGDGAGGFVESASATVGGFPTALVVSDFDRDGRMDVASDEPPAGHRHGPARRRHGRRDGNADYAAGIGPTSVATEDFNGDSWPDLAVTDSEHGGALRPLGDGPGFSRASPSGGPEPASAAAGDLNGDTQVDLAVANQVSESVTPCSVTETGLHRRQPGGRNAAERRRGRPGRGPWADLAILASNAVGVFLSQGASGFAPLRRFGAGPETRALVAGDFDEDGRMDVLTANDGSEENANVTLLRGEGGGSLAGAPVFEAGFRPRGVAAADLTGDAKTDLAVAGFFGVTVLEGDGSGGFGSIGTYQAGSGPAAVAVGDVDQDGVPDLAVANEGSGSVSILVGLGGGAFAPPLNIPVDLALKAVGLGDLDGDGSNDLAVASSSGIVSVFLATGPATFGAPSLYAAGLSPQALAMAQLNADVRPDILVANSASGDVSVLLGSGGGAFVPAVSHAVGPTPAALVLEDLDGDSKLDVAVAAGEQVTVLRGDGAGGLAAGTPQSVGFQPVGVAAVDFNADGTRDLAVAKGGGEGLAVLAGTGGGGFAPRRLLAAGYHPSGLAAAHLDQDGRPDLAVVSRDDDSVWIYLASVAVAGADLSVSISDSADPVLTDDVFTYTITVTNAGPLPATAVQLRNRLPQSVQFLSTFPGPPACVFQGTGSSSEVLCQLGTIAPLSSRTVTADVRAGPSSLTLVDEAWALAHSLDPDPPTTTAARRRREPCRPRGLVQTRGPGGPGTPTPTTSRSPTSARHPAPSTWCRHRRPRRPIHVSSIAGLPVSGLRRPRRPVPGAGPGITVDVGAHGSQGHERRRRDLLVDRRFQRLGQRDDTGPARVRQGAGPWVEAPAEPGRARHAR
jgi:uncharacterized repeat protein (TIGR01451 family)